MRAHERILLAIAAAVLLAVGPAQATAPDWDQTANIKDAALRLAEMIAVDRPVLFDCRVAALANCYPMIPSGKAHNEMLLGDAVSEAEIEKAIGKEGKMLV